MMPPPVFVPEPSRSGFGCSASDAFLALRQAVLVSRPPAPTGFSPLDEVLQGGIAPGDLVLLGGKPGAGKTVAALQWARHQAVLGRTAVFACYEHQEHLLLYRLLMMGVCEAAHAQGCSDELRLEAVRLGLRGLVAGTGEWRDYLGGDPLVAEAAERLSELGRRLILFCVGSGLNGVASLERTLDECSEEPALLVVDYLQKVPAAQASGDVRAAPHVAEELKGMAMRRDLAVVAVVVAHDSGLASRRLRLEHLRDSSAVGYEADTVIVLNHKMNIVSRLHLAYDTTRAYEFRNQVVFSVEKHRAGLTDVDLEFRHDFANYRFDPRGNWVAERLAQGVDE